ncbi:hypothetical protein CHRYSEOSP005_25890 [Chryseobacterium sp. Alg-005]
MQITSKIIPHLKIVDFLSVFMNTNVLPFDLKVFNDGDKRCQIPLR